MTLRHLYTYVMNSIKERPQPKLQKMTSNLTSPSQQQMMTPTQPTKESSMSTPISLPPPLTISFDSQQPRTIPKVSSTATLEASNLTKTPSESTFTKYTQSKIERKTILEFTTPSQQTLSSLDANPPTLQQRQPLQQRHRSDSINEVSTINTKKDNAIPITYRERLGGYLHPRDMRRLVTPFSTSNEAELIVRRHVMLLNFDPLRAIVLRDRLLVVVPDGADTILEELEKRLRGGIEELENFVFGDGGGSGSGDTENAGDNDAEEVIVMKMEDVEDVVDIASGAAFTAVHSPWDKVKFASGTKTNERMESFQDEGIRAGISTAAVNGMSTKAVNGKNKDESSPHNNDNDDNADNSKGDNDTTSSSTTTTNSSLNPHDFEDEWDDLEKRNWIDMPFELQSVDAVITSVTSMLHQDTLDLTVDCHYEMNFIRIQGESAPERLRQLKDYVNALQRRVQGFIRAINLILDDDEDMALMNLSRLITHPERFIQPVSEEIIHEESDEPELILEGHLQQALNTVNSLELLKGQLDSTETAVNMNLDGVRNKLLFINTLVTVASFCTAVASLVGSIFGMNLVNHLEENENAFIQVVVGTLVGTFFLFISMLFLFYQASTFKKLDVSSAQYRGRD